MVNRLKNSYDATQICYQGKNTKILNSLESVFRTAKKSEREKNSTMKQLHKHARTLESAQPMVQRATSGHFLKPTSTSLVGTEYMCPQTTQ